MRSVEQRKYQTEYIVIPSINYKNIIPEILLEVVRQVQQLQYRTIGDIATVNKHTNIWIENILNNMLNLLRDQSIDCLKKVLVNQLLLLLEGHL